MAFRPPDYYKVRKKKKQKKKEKEQGIEDWVWYQAYTQEKSTEQYGR